MKPTRDRRLERLVGRAAANDAAADARRSRLAARATVGTVLRGWLAELGVDPAQVARLRACDEAAAELAALPAPAPPRPHQAATPGCGPGGGVRGPGAAGLGDRHGRPPKQAGAARLEAKLLDMAQRVGAAGEIDFARASLAETVAWCVARLAARAAAPPREPPSEPPSGERS